MAGTYKGKSTAAGGGGRFAMLKDKLQASGRSASSAGAIAAAIGRKKFGAKKMGQFSKEGIARAAKRS